MSVVNEPRRRLTASARRALIEQAARDAFAESGYQAVSMGEIATAAGVTRSVLYDYAPSKRALFEQLLRDEHADLTARLAASILVAEPPYERLARALDDFVAYVDEHPIAGRVLADEPFGDEELEAVRHALHSQTKAALAGWIANDAGDRFDAASVRGHVLIDAVYGALVGVASSRRRPRRPPRDEVVAATLDLLWAGLAPVLNGEAAGS
ncbi:MAG: TetR/AcrR family transcriptional regulator [Solirubrobacteraceae bacterium]|nr:TetR/AcrR family transcriptional regulator [Solirubrobacteraceae bacterium]